MNLDWITIQVVDGLERMFGLEISAKRLLAGATPTAEELITTRAQYAVVLRLRQELSRRQAKAPSGENVVQLQDPGAPRSA